MNTAYTDRYRQQHSSRRRFTSAKWQPNANYRIRFAFRRHTAHRCRSRFGYIERPKTTHSGSLHTETSSKNALSSRTETHRADAASRCSSFFFVSGNENHASLRQQYPRDGSQIMAENHLNMQAAGISTSAPPDNTAASTLFDQTQKSGLTASLSDGVASAGYSKSRPKPATIGRKREPRAQPNRQPQGQHHPRRRRIARYQRRPSSNAGGDLVSGKAARWA